MTSPRRFRHVLCVYPYRQELGRVGFFPPIGLEYIAAVLKPHAEQIEIIDLRKDPKHTRDYLRADTDLVCFSVNWDRERAFLCEEIHSVPDGPFVLAGGRHATEDPDAWFQLCPRIDAIVRGDGEEVVEELCRGHALDQIDGLSFRRNGTVHHGPNRKLGPVNNDLYPDRSLRRYRYQVEVEGVETGVAVDMLSGSRGCPFNCTFCSFSRNPWGEKRQWTARSAESLVKELEEVDARIVGFSDDLFTFDMDRVEQFCDLVLARGIRKHYLVNARLEIAKRPDLLRKMERAGFLFLMLGIESAHDKTLRAMRKGFDTAKIKEYFAVLRRSSIFMHGYFILGNLGENLAEIEQIVPFAHELGVDTLALSTLRVSPHSGLDELVAQTPGYHVARNGKIFCDEYSVRDLRLLRRRLYRRFYRPKQLLRLLGKCYRSKLYRLLPATLFSLPRMTFLGTARTLRRFRRRAANERQRATALHTMK